MSKYAIRRGHQRTGGDGCAEDILNEIDVVNSYYPYVIEGLQALGHEVLDVTPSEGYRSLSDSLMSGVRTANNWGADYFISCHANCAERTSRPQGCEVIYCEGSTQGRVLAENVDYAIANLGLKDRGAKKDVRGLCEIKRTYAPSIIIEPFFISSEKDVEIFNSIGAKALGYAIVEGLTGQKISTRTIGWNHNTKGYWYCTNVDMGYFYRDEWKCIDGVWYSFDSEGYARHNTWLKDQGSWFYLTSDCSMARNQWLWVDNECYYFGDSGKLFMDCTTPDGFVVDKTGAWVH